MAAPGSDGIAVQTAPAPGPLPRAAWRGAASPPQRAAGPPAPGPAHGGWTPTASSSSTAAPPGWRW
eukprot:2093887-Lingulodinium_polyedra.AAC.1